MTLDRAASDRSSPEEEASTTASSSPVSRRRGRSSGIRGTSTSSSTAGEAAGATSRAMPTSGTSTFAASSPSTSSPAASPASPPPSPDVDEGRPMIGGSGRSSLEPFASYGRDGWSSRTSQASFSLFETEAPSSASLPSTTYSATWPRAGMTRSGRAFRRQALGPRIIATASGSSPILPTPLVTDSDGGRRSSHGRPDGLQATVQARWPTPLTADATGSRGSKGRLRPDEGGLASAVTRAEWELWPTPKAQPSPPDYARASRPQSGGDDLAPAVAREFFLTPHGFGTDGSGGELDAQLRHGPSRRSPDGSPELWPTPRASEWKGTGPIGSSSHQHRLSRSYLDATVQDRDQSSGPLNPPWVEWLMGWPVGATDCGHSATASCPRSRKSSDG